MTKTTTKRTTRKVEPIFDHPAKFSNREMVVLDAMLPNDARILDPMAGVGRIHELATKENGRTTVGVDIEPEWGACPGNVQGDATKLRYKDGSFNAVATSVTYGNRMADHHDAKDACKHCIEGKARLSPRSKKWEVCKKCGGTGLSKRNTYTHVIGHKLAANNTGAMYWRDDAYRTINALILAEIKRVLEADGDFLLVISDHMKDNERVAVVPWYLEQCRKLGFTLIDIVPCGIPRNRNGANAEQRVDASLVLHYRRSRR